MSEKGRRDHEAHLAGQTHGAKQKAMQERGDRPGSAVANQANSEAADDWAARQAQAALEVHQRVLATGLPVVKTLLGPAPGCASCVHHQAVALDLEVQLAGLKAQLATAERQRDESLASGRDQRLAHQKHLASLRGGR